MPLTRAQVEAFCVDLAELFNTRTPPRFSHRRRVRCRWNQQTLHLGRRPTRADLAHQLAHYFHGHFLFRDGLPRRGHWPRLHSREFQRWQLLIGNYIAQEFGEGEGVTL